MNKQQIPIAILEQAFHDYYEGLHRYAYSITRENEAAKDIVQQIFLALCERKEKVPVMGSLKSYLFRAVHNRSINYRTRTKRSLTLEDKTEYIHTPGFIYPLEMTDMQKQIKAAIEKLPAQCRVVFLKNRDEEKTYAETASELGIAVKTVEAQMTKALKILRRELAALLFCL